MKKKYVHRAIEKELKAGAAEFPVVVVTGPRQTGKSTLLQTLFPKYAYATLDDPLTRAAAHADPTFFLARAERMIIDEIQYAPELLPYVKIAVDRQRALNGRYVLTGSQLFPLMAGVSESLAGRVALYELLCFSGEEAAWLKLDKPDDCFSAMFKGFFPEVVVHGADRNRFYSAYLQTYLDRDIRQITSVHDLKIFQNFLELLAARAGALLNLNEIAKEAGISFTSAKRWLSLLETTRIVYLLRPYTRNISRRVVKSPKVYFTDTGLLSFLLRYPDPASLQAGPQAGSMFENLIIAELLKYRHNHNKNYELFFYRDSAHNEIDVIVDCGPALYLLEIKSTATPRPGQFGVLRAMTAEWPQSTGYLLSFTQEKQKISDRLCSMPWDSFLEMLATCP
ncbi:MAG: ATP-binding protein [Candidatus Omnitrophica bacterium]|nr:ATP-binding protein [Candidatus Omnitrophota bacterium]